MSFPLYRRPGGVIFVDDDRDYLEILAEVMPANWYVRLFLRPVACIDILLQEPARWEADAWRQQDIVNRWREGVALIPQILKYWREDAVARFALTQVCVVDYSMPAMSGLRMLGELTAWSGSRILLTGRADEQLAVSAFNRGLIQLFIPKQSPDIRLLLSGAIDRLLRQPEERHQQTWRATLSREQHALLCHTDVEDGLEEVSVRQGWIEHVVIGAPFGVLAVDQNGTVSWLQLEPPANLQELADMARSQGWDDAVVQDIACGRKLIDLELQPALGEAHKPQPQAAFAIGSGATLLHAAIFRVAPSQGLAATSSYQQFIAASGERKPLD